MSLEHFKRRLLQKERELLADIERLQAEAREPLENEVQDEVDEATSSEARSAAFQKSSLEFSTLQQVRDALQRIEDGTYGTCVVCGRPIDDERLQAVPYATLCIDDKRAQERS